jgi:hypothetical protein
MMKTMKMTRMMYQVFESEGSEKRI